MSAWFDVRSARASFSGAIFAGTIPLYVAAVGIYGWKVLVILGLCVLAGALTDFVAGRVRQDEAIRYNWLVWVLFPLAIPAGIPLWAPPLALSFSLVFGMHFFGGYGRNLFNLIAIGVVFLQLSYPAELGNSVIKPFADPRLGFQHYASQINFPGTIFDDLRKFGDIPIRDFFLGRIPGNIGESFPGYLAVLGLLLTLARILDYRMILSSLFGIIATAAIGHAYFPTKIIAPEFQLLVGAVLPFLVLFSGDVFSLPRTPEGRWLGGLAFGFFTVLIRGFSGFSEGVFFAALLMGVFIPICDQLIAAHWYRKPVKSA